MALWRGTSAAMVLQAPMLRLQELEGRRREEATLRQWLRTSLPWDATLRAATGAGWASLYASGGRPMHTVAVKVG